MGQPGSSQPGSTGALAGAPRRNFGKPGISIRMPAVEELLRQMSIVNSSLTGRELTNAEIELARPIFGRSIDFSRVRILRTGILEYRTVGNVIRVETGFSISQSRMAQTLIHELTHVWQYQQGGTGYMSSAIQAQIGAVVTSGSRNTAYDYVTDSNKSFFNYGPEQQGFITENYFAMLRDQSSPVTRISFISNHLDAQGNYLEFDRATRLAEIGRELPIHENFIVEIKRTRPRSESAIMNNPDEYMFNQVMPGRRSDADNYIFRPILRIDF